MQRRIKSIWYWTRVWFSVLFDLRVLFTVFMMLCWAAFVALVVTALIKYVVGG